MYPSCQAVCQLLQFQTVSIQKYVSLGHKGLGVCEPDKTARQLVFQFLVTKISALDMQSYLYRVGAHISAFTFCNSQGFWTLFQNNSLNSNT